MSFQDITLFKRVSNWIGSNTRTTFLLVFAVGFYGVTTLDYKLRDESKLYLVNKNKREDAFYSSLEGQQELAIAREIKKNEHRMRKEEEEEMAKTEEGRETLELERMERSLSLRFKATNLQYELLKLDRSIEKHESLQRIQMLEQAKKMRNLAFMAAKEAGKAES